MSGPYLAALVYGAAGLGWVLWTVWPLLQCYEVRPDR